MGLERLPCLVEDVDDRRRLLLQLFANLQREDITPLEESAGIKSLTEGFGYSQTRVAELLNKSPSYISQILGLERLGEQARQFGAGLGEQARQFGGGLALQQQQLAAQQAWQQAQLQQQQQMADLDALMKQYAMMFGMF